VVLAAVHPLRIDRRPGTTVTIAKPLEQVAILAPAAAERRVFRHRWLVAQGAGFGLVRRSRHTRPTWEERGRRAS
jgi:hypothetical protein